MIIVLNGPLGIGKSTLAEALGEAIAHSVVLDGDRLVAANPPPTDELDHLHTILAFLLDHHRRLGYRHFVIDHAWTAPGELADLRRRLYPVAPDDDIHCFRLTLPAPENLRRIERRASVRVRDEIVFERQQFAKEAEAFARDGGTELGEPFEVSAPPAELVDMMLRRLGMR